MKLASSRSKRIETSERITQGKGQRFELKEMSGASFFH
jgi:hypothetical protein